jgi:fatty acid desaturase
MTATAALERTSERPARTDYAELKHRVQAAGLLDKQPAFSLRSIAFRLVFLTACILVFVLFRQAWVQVLNAVALGIICGQLGFQLHDSGHRQLFQKGSRLNTAIGLITGDLLLGMSYGWWVNKHNQHHANPNHVELDPDIDSGVISYSVEQAVAKRGVSRLVARYQAFFFFPLLFLLGWAMHAASGTFLATRQSRYRRLEVALLVAHVLLYAGSLLLLLGPWAALMVIVIQRCVGGFYLGSVFAPNHKGMPQMDAGSQIDFLRRQVLTSRNVRAHPLTDVLYGGLNYQVEHHLFPTMTRNQVARAHPIVVDFCRTEGIPYHETSIIQSFREILGFLHEVGAPLRGASAG